MVKVFISYARADASEIAKELANSLRALNHEVFLDIHGIPGGAQWEKQLIQQAQWCDSLVLLITPASNQSKYVYHEFREAEKNQKLIIPVQVDNAPLLPHLSHLNVLKLEDDNYDGLLLKLEIAFKGLKTRKSGNVGIYLGLFLTLVVIVAVVAVFLMNQPVTTSTETPTEDISSPTSITPSSTVAAESPVVIVNSPTNSAPNPPRPSNTPRPPTNTPEPFTPILINENFEDGLAQGWEIAEGNWLAVPDNANIAYHRTDTVDRYADIIVGDENWQNYSLDFDIKTIDASTGGRVFIHLYENFTRNKIIFVLDFDDNTVQLFEVYNDNTSQLTVATNYVFGENQWTRVRFVVSNEIIAVFLNDVRTLTRRLNSYQSLQGLVRFRSPNPNIYFDNVIIWHPEE